MPQLFVSSDEGCLPDLTRKLHNTDWTVQHLHVAVAVMLVERRAYLNEHHWQACWPISPLVISRSRALVPMHNCHICTTLGHVWVTGDFREILSSSEKAILQQIDCHRIVYNSKSMHRVWPAFPKDLSHASSSAALVDWAWLVLGWAPPPSVSNPIPLQPPDPQLPWLLSPFHPENKRMVNLCAS